MEACIEEKLKLFAPDKYCLVNAGDSVRLNEKSKDGKASIECTCQEETLVFPTQERNVLPYLDETIKGARACADKFLFTANEDGWDLHVIELKKTIGTDTFAKSKNQFRMGIYNGRALAGFMGMKLKEIHLHSAFRSDRIHSISPGNLAAMRAQNNWEIQKIIEEWNADQCTLSVDLEERTYTLGKIKLDELGQGEIVLYRKV